MIDQTLGASIPDLHGPLLPTTNNFSDGRLDQSLDFFRSSSYASVGQTPLISDELEFSQQHQAFANSSGLELSSKFFKKTSDLTDADSFFFPLQDTTKKIDFEGDQLHSGTLVSDQIDGVYISTNTRHGAMLFDTNRPTGGDEDLQSSTLDHVLILSEDGDSSDPDDNATGGTFYFDFQNLSDISNISLLDIDKAGSTIEFLDLWGQSIQTFDVPKMANNEFRDFDFNVENVASLEISLTGSGAVAEIEFTPSSTILDLAVNPEINPLISLDDQPTIGIIDTGFSANNPDINYSNITLGRDRIDNDDNPLLEPGEGSDHGTHILGTISATQNNGIGIDGVNDQAPLWVSRAIGSGELADGIAEFVAFHIDSERSHAILNLSLDVTQQNPDGQITTRYELTSAERQAIEFARQHNVILVVAAGNNAGVMSALGQASQEFDNIVTVGAADGLERAGYSSYGVGLDILAQGGTPDNPILSTVGDGLGTMAGTSVATAQVTGAMSQVWAANPNLNYRQVIDIVKATAIDLDTVGWDVETGNGLLNLAEALRLAQTAPFQEYSAPASIIPSTWSGEGTLIPLERAAARRPYEFASQGDVDDSLWEIAERELGDPYRWVEIQKEDGTTYSAAEAKLIQPRTIVYLPDDTPSPTPTPSPDPISSPVPTPIPGIIPDIPIDPNSSNYTSGQRNPYAYNSALIGQCTWFSYGRMVETGLLPDNARTGGWFLSHAATWVQDAIAAGLPVTDTPTQGARGLVILPAGVGGAHSIYGHVAFLEEVYADGSIRISEANWAGVKTPTERTLSPAEYGGMKFVQLEDATAATVTSPPPAIPGVQNKHVVAEGDTLWGIAERKLGSGYRWREITREDGTTFTEEEARYLEIGTNVYLPVNYTATPIPIIDSPGTNPVLDPSPETPPVSEPDPIIEPEKDNWEALGYAVWDWTRNGGDATKYTQSPVFRKVLSGSVDAETNSTAIDPNQETIVVVHGWEGPGTDAMPLQSGEPIYELAKSIQSKRQDAQVLLLDWHLQAESKILPHGAAGWVEPVADWAVETLKKTGFDTGDNVTVVGHSLGSYVASEIAEEYSGIKGLIALDPAAYGTSEYDLHWTRFGRQTPDNFWDVTDRTLAFVGSDFFLLGGIAGDNAKAGTAHDSFIIDFNRANSGEVHSGVTWVFKNIIDRNYLGEDFTNWTLPEHQDNWYDHGDLGLKNNPFSQPDKFHEGIIFTQGSGSDRSVKELQTITGRDWLSVPVKNISWT